MEAKEYTIIGWGIAGATLAWQFHKNGIPCKVYDSGKNYSSKISAGMINPIVFRSMNKGWNVDVLMPYAKAFYKEIEEKLNTQILFERSISKIITSIEEQNNWASKEKDDRYIDYLGPIEDLNLEKVNAPHGIGKVKSSGNLDVKKFLELSKSYLIDQGTEFVNRSFSSKEIDQEHYIYCEGYQLLQNPFFGYLPLRATHGDVLMILAPELKYDQILNRNMFVLPMGNDHYKIGSTYNWGVTDPEPNEKGRQDLEQRLKEFCSFEYEVVSHEGGIRPTTEDRRPLLGTHPQKKNLHVYNGLGTKGVSMAPYFSEHMFEYLVEGKELDDEVNINRFEKHFNA